MILQLTPNTHPILHERVKKCSYDLDRAEISKILYENMVCLLYTSPSPRDRQKSRMPSSA